jgi:hypothetical protein
MRSRRPTCFGSRSPLAGTTLDQIAFECVAQQRPHGADDVADSARPETSADESVDERLQVRAAHVRDLVRAELGQDEVLEVVPKISEHSWLVARPAAGHDDRRISFGPAEPRLGQLANGHPRGRHVRSAIELRPHTRLP